MLRESTSISSEEKERYQPYMTSNYMSSEESVSEEEPADNSGSDSDVEEPKRKSLCTKPLLWRSDEMNSLMVRLDRKVARRLSQRGASMRIQRNPGPPSTRPAPDDAPEFAVKSQ